MRYWLGDTLAMYLRNLLRMKRSPDAVVFTLFQPIMFVLLFSKVFGGAIPVPGTNYTNYLMAGIFAQSVVFGGTISGMYMVIDINEGILNRFRTLPMSQSSVLFGRSLADITVNLLSISVMVVTGICVGWRYQNGLLSFLLGIGLLLLFSWAMSWLTIFIGTFVRKPEAYNAAVVLIVFPLTFLSNAFVPTKTMPQALQVFANWNPISALIQSVRESFGNQGTSPVPDTVVMQHSFAATLIGIAVILAVFIPLAIARFKQRS